MIKAVYLSCSLKGYYAFKLERRSHSLGKLNVSECQGFLDINKNNRFYGIYRGFTIFSGSDRVKKENKRKT